MKCVQQLLLNCGCWLSTWSWRPSKLFDGSKSANLSLSIFISSSTQKNFISDYRRWNTEERSNIFKLTRYCVIPNNLRENVIPKIGTFLESSLYERCLNIPALVNSLVQKDSQYKLYYKRTGGLYWKITTDFQPKLYLDGVETVSSKEESVCFECEQKLYSSIALLWSDFYWWWYQINSDVRNNNPSDVFSTPCKDSFRDDHVLISLTKRLMNSLQKNAVWAERAFQGRISRYKSFIPKLSKSIIDEIDVVLAHHYGFTDEELDFIINYDIKYRMGDELNNSDE